MWLGTTPREYVFSKYFLSDKKENYGTVSSIFNGTDCLGLAYTLRGATRPGDVARPVNNCRAWRSYAPMLIELAIDLYQEI